VYLEDTFPLNNSYDAQFVKTPLPIKDFPIRHFPGLWQVEIYYHGYSIDRKEFHILPWDPGTYAPAKTAKPTSGKISQLWEVVNERRAAEENPVFLEKFGRARALFQKGRLGQAKLILDEILKEEPYRTEAHLGLAAVYFELEKWNEALAELDYVVQNPDYRAKALALRDEIIEMSSQKQELSHDPR
jgi:tetratricopeptide (TPR) repeat protein